MKKLIHWLDEYLEISLCVALMSVMTVVIFVQVVMRYVFHNSLTWSEEFARYCFIWLIYLGISYGCKIMKHIKIDAALKLFPEKMRPYVVIFGDRVRAGICRVYRDHRMGADHVPGAAWKDVARAWTATSVCERGTGGRILPGGDQADTDHILQGRAIRKGW